MHSQYKNYNSVGKDYGSCHLLFKKKKRQYLLKPAYSLKSALNIPIITCLTSKVVIVLSPLMSFLSTWVYNRLRASGFVISPNALPMVPVSLSYQSPYLDSIPIQSPFPPLPLESL